MTRTYADLSFCPTCNRWFAGMAVAFGVVGASFLGAGIASATESDSSAGGSASESSSSAKSDTSSATKREHVKPSTGEASTPPRKWKKERGVGETPAGKRDVKKDSAPTNTGSDPDKSDTGTSESDKSSTDSPSTDTKGTETSDAAGTSVVTDETDTPETSTAETASPTETSTATTTDTEDAHSSSAAVSTAKKHVVTQKVSVTPADADAVKESAADTTDSAVPVSSTPESVENAPSISTAGESVSKVASQSSASMTVETLSPAPVATEVAMAAPSTATSTAAAEPDFWTSLFLSWQRAFNNATPTVPSKTVTVTLEDAASTSQPIAFGGSDGDGDAAVYSVPATGATGGPKYGTVTIDQSTGTFVYNPTDSLTSQTITDTFTVTITDQGSHIHGLFGWLTLNSGHSSTATITVVVNPVNSTPTAVNDAISGLVNNTVTGNVLTNDTDANGDVLTATLVSSPTHGTLVFNNSDGSFTYTPNTGFSGTDTFTYTATDGKTTSAIATATLTIAEVTTSDGTLTIGVNGLDWFRGLSAADTNKALDMAEAAGVTSVRLDISWYVVESTKGTYDWSYTDPLVDAVLAHRMTVIGQVFDTPAWLSGSTNYHTPPTTDAQVAAFAKFAADAATHYNGKITTWEIWNEPNLEQFWTNPDPVAYAKLLKAVYPAIKAVNPNATVVTGGLAPMPGTGIDGTVAWVEALYAAGAGGYFDALGVHPYYWPAVPNMNAIAAMHDVMVANGDGDKQIWLTEAGAPTGTAARAVSEAVQAQTIAKVVQFAREHDYIGAVYIYSLFDTGTNSAEPEDNFGVLRRDFTPKAAWGVWNLTDEELAAVANGTVVL